MIQNSTTQKHFSPDQYLSGSLKTFLVTDTTTDAWNDANKEATLRNICQGVQAVANLVMIGSANDSAAAGAGMLRIACENNGESAENIQAAVRTATGHSTATVADFKF